MASKTPSSGSGTAGAAGEGGQTSTGTPESGSMPFVSSMAEGDLGTATAEATEQIGESVAHLGDQVRQQVMTRLGTETVRVASGLETAAGLLRGAGEQLRALDQQTAAKYVDGAAERTTELSRSLREQDVSQLIEGAEQYARRQPGLFLGGALALGFLGARFFASSTPKPEAPPPPQPAPQYELPPSVPPAPLPDYTGAMTDLPPVTEASYADATTLDVDYGLDLAPADTVDDVDSPLLDDYAAMPEKR